MQVTGGYKRPLPRIVIVHIEMIYRPFNSWAAIEVIRMRAALVFMCMAVLVAGACPGDAGDAEGQQPMTVQEQSVWGAVGQITYGGPKGSAICTGTLVAANLVLTAGHCVAHGGVPMRAGDIQFSAGWRTGESLAIRRGSAIILAAPQGGVAKTLAQDVALIVLDEPISAEEITPMELSDQGMLSEIYGFVGYRRDAPDVLQREMACPLVGVTPGILRLGCEVVSGNSGAPVLQQRGGKWQVAAVMVARAGDALSVAVIPGDDLRVRIAGR